MKQYVIKLGNTYYTRKGFYGYDDGTVPDDVIIYPSKKESNKVISMMTKEAKQKVELILYNEDKS